MIHGRKNKERRVKILGSLVYWRQQEGTGLFKIEDKEIWRSAVINVKNTSRYTGEKTERADEWMTCSACYIGDNKRAQCFLRGTEDKGRWCSVVANVKETSNDTWEKKQRETSE